MISFRGALLKIKVSKSGVFIKNLSDIETAVLVHGQQHVVKPNDEILMKI
jgi:maltose phosphorylase